MRTLQGTVRGAKLAPPIEWQICDTDAEWQTHRHDALAATVSQPDGMPLPTWVARHWRTGTVLLFVLALIGGWTWRVAERGVAQIEAELQASIESELWMAAQQDDPEYASHVITNHFATGQDGMLLPQRGAIKSFTLRGETAIVKFVTQPIADQPALRYTRFYRQSAEGWVRIKPDAEMWGEPRHLESAHFIFHFRQNDAQVMAEVAPQIDDIYAALQHNFGLTPKLAKQVIEVSVQEATGTMPLPRAYRGRLVVASPAVYPAPVEVSDRAILVQSIALLLIDEQKQQAIEAHQIPQRWQPLLRGLGLWQMWELDVPLALWKQEVIQWFYVDLPEATPQQQFVLPAGYEELCATHHLWMLSPVVIGIPLKCSTFDTSIWSLRRGSVHVPQMTLDELRMPLADWQTQASGELDFPYFPNETLALATLVEYVVSVYGNEQLPVWLASLSRYDDWETLVPTVFGISAADFEAGWRSYLAQHYHVSLESAYPAEK